jgi:hypothetical protein
LIPAGFFRILWRIGMRGCRVGEVLVARHAHLFCEASIVNLNSAYYGSIRPLRTRQRRKH